MSEPGEARGVAAPAIALALEGCLHQRFHRGLGEGIREQPLLGGAHLRDLLERRIEDESTDETALQRRAAGLGIGRWRTGKDGSEPALQRPVSHLEQPRQHFRGT